MTNFGETDGEERPQTEISRPRKSENKTGKPGETIYNISSQRPEDDELNYPKRKLFANARNMEEIMQLAKERKKERQARHGVEVDDEDDDANPTIKNYPDAFVLFIY